MIKTENIILIIIDTCRARNMGAYGATPSPTPVIDNLAKGGIVFTNAYTTATKTDPAITSIMSGIYPLSTGILNHGRDVTKEEEKTIPSVTFLAEILKNHGYKTFAVDWLSRWHKRGYQYYSGKIIKNSKGKYIKERIPLAPLFRIIQLVDNKIFIKLLNRELLYRFYYSFSSDPLIPYDPADIVVNRAINVLKKNRSRKRFLYLHFWDTHWPYTRKRNIKEYFFDDLHESYNKELRFIDSEIGKLVDYLRDKKELDKSLFIIVGDHGESLNEHQMNGHKGLYQEVTTVPLIFSHPSLPSKKSNTLVQHVDILPTTLDLLSIPKPQTIDGISLLPSIEKKGGKGRDFAFFEDRTRSVLVPFWYRRKRGIVTESFKYIETLAIPKNDLGKLVLPEDVGVKRRELYNLLCDPKEKNNIVNKNLTIANKLRSQMMDNIQLLHNKRLRRTNSKLYEKVQKAITVIQTASKRADAKDIAVAWTGGKDSTVLLHLVRMAFGGKIPFKVIFNDSTIEFEEIYAFIDHMKKFWDINLITIKHSDKELKEFHDTKDRPRKKELSRLMKITAINTALKKYKLKALMAAIRWDEHSSRSKEKYFSPRADHIRIHPLLHFTEKDIWEYTRHFGVPYVDLYDKGYRSLGEKPFTKPVPPGGNERSGREKDKEKLMERLRNMGYW